MEIYARQGDLVFRKEPIPEGIELQPATEPISLAGSQHRHIIEQFEGVLVGRRGATVMLRVGEERNIRHEKEAEGHRALLIEAGDYHVAPLVEGDDGRRVDD